MKQSYKTYSVRIPKGPISDFVDASGNGVYLRSLFYQSLGQMEAQRLHEFLCSEDGSVQVRPEDLIRYAFAEVFAEELPRTVRKSRKILILCEGETEVNYFKEFAICAHQSQKRDLHRSPASCY